jgi:hypothetical protein
MLEQLLNSVKLENVTMETEECGVVYSKKDIKILQALSIRYLWNVNIIN